MLAPWDLDQLYQMGLRVIVSLSEEADSETTNDNYGKK